ncbi:hypothetical protein [Arthrobacter sp. H5]|uniref:hypothetical protein n=1 Tax=Arthrobacter sp. H5 TaxID=1267973 RepID=UPI00047F0449|nr:hypothetical protein [Arthrobacter sp. H5]
MTEGHPFPSEQGSLLDDGVPAYPAAAAQTGDGDVDTLLLPLAGMSDIPVQDQTAAYETLHDGLLSELNTDHG